MREERFKDEVDRLTPIIIEEPSDYTTIKKAITEVSHFLRKKVTEVLPNKPSDTYQCISDSCHNPGHSNCTSYQRNSFYNNMLFDRHKFHQRFLRHCMYILENEQNYI